MSRRASRPRTSRIGALVASVLLGTTLSVGCAANRAPDIADARLPDPLPTPYQPAADARADLDRALARARSTGKRVLIELGGNWCADCRVVAGVLAIPEAKRFMDEHYVVVTVDVGRMDRNLDIPGRFGVTLAGVPTLLVLDGEGRLLNAATSAELTSARDMKPQAILDYFARWSD